MFAKWYDMWDCRCRKIKQVYHCEHYWPDEHNKCVEGVHKKLSDIPSTLTTIGMKLTRRYYSRRVRETCRKYSFISSVSLTNTLILAVAAQDVVY